MRLGQVAAGSESAQQIQRKEQLRVDKEAADAVFAAALGEQQWMRQKQKKQERERENVREMEKEHQRRNKAKDDAWRVTSTKSSVGCERKK